LLTPAPDSRSTQFFISFIDNSKYDRLGFAPFGQVTSGMENVDRLYSGYGDGAPNGTGPIQQKIQTEGNAYLVKAFPKLDYVKKATVENR
jgi:cyclophilin family peptidyl-prolyl cis-trans isomerase